MSYHERWKVIDDYPLYEISDQGNVRNTKSGRLLHTYITPKGYKVVTLSDHGVQKTVLVHKLVAEAFVEKYYDDLDVAFLDGNKSNPVASNLDWWKRRDVHRRSYRLHGRTQLHKMKRIMLMETGEIFQSITEASHMLGISRGAISRSLNCRSRCTKEGYTFIELN